MGRIRKYQKTDDNSTITISNGNDHTLIKSHEDIILNGRRMGGFLLYSGSGKLYIDRLAENERVFIAESLEIKVRLLAVNLISMLTVTLGLEPDFEILSQDKKLCNPCSMQKEKLIKSMTNSYSWLHVLIPIELYYIWRQLVHT